MPNSNSELSFPHSHKSSATLNSHAKRKGHTRDQAESCQTRYLFGFHFSVHVQYTLVFYLPVYRSTPKYRHTGIFSYAVYGKLAT